MTTPIGAPPPDLGAVDELCRLARAAHRLGCTVQLGGASDELRALLDLAGVGDLLCATETMTRTDPHPRTDQDTETVAGTEGAVLR